MKDNGKIINENGEQFANDRQERRTAAAEKILSPMVALSMNNEPLPEMDELVERLRAMPDITVISINDSGLPYDAVIEYKGERYDISFGRMYQNNEIDESFFRHHMSDEERGSILTAEDGVASVMMFGNDALDSFHLQIKIMNALLPDMAGLMDIVTMRVLSGRWVRLAAESEYPPAAEYQLCIHAIGDDDSGNVWLHTHGLRRCGVIDLEILGSNPENYQQHSRILENIAERGVAENGLFDEGEKAFSAVLPDDIYVAVTWIDWRKAIETYPSNMPGGIGDHETEEDAFVHPVTNGVLFVYKNPSDEEQGIYEHISCYDGMMDGHMMLLINNRETENMKGIAIERLEYFLSAVRRGCQAIAKLGLDVDGEEDKPEESREKEHMWFDIVEVEGDNVVGISHDDAFNISSVKAGDQLTLPLSRITSWRFLEGDTVIEPDNIYLLELIK